MPAGEPRQTPDPADRFIAMRNPRLDLLSDYPFARLRALLDHEPTPAGLDVVNLSIGEPQHAMPAFVADHLSSDLGSLSRYPTPNGSPDYRIACADWLTRRYNLPEDRKSTRLNSSHYCASRMPS